MAVVVEKDRNVMENSMNSWIRGSLIGQGAFGKVNLALNRESGELFAVKSIDWCGDDSRMSGEMKAMENEVEILQSLKNSPFVVNCLGSSVSVENGKSMRNVFMEYMPGGSVADLMKKFGGSGFEEPLIRKYTRGILEGIRYLHAERIVHCDIKGRNVLVGSTGVVKLADFGGARRLGLDGGEEDQPAAVLTVDSDLLNVKGTPLWMAPEVVRQVEQGPASDIWSLGCTVVEMATGKAPWSDIVGSDPFVALYHIGCTEEVPNLPSCLSEQGKDFLSKCFQRDPRVRWTASQLLQHPFVTDKLLVQTNESSLQEKFSSSSPTTSGLDFVANKPTDNAPLPSSPTSAFDFPSTSSSAMIEESAAIVNSVPILRSPLQFFAKRFPQQQQQQGASNFFQTEEAQHKESTTTTTTSSTDFWCNSPLSDFGGQWITVRTPQTISPASSSPTMSSFAASKFIANSRVEEDELALLEVKEEIPEVVASCCASTSTEEGVGMTEEENEEEQLDESLEIRTTEQASCSSSSITAPEASACCHKCGNQKGEENDFSRTKFDNSEKCCCPRAPAAAAVDDDQRCIDNHGVPKHNAASWSAPLRNLQIGSAHSRKLTFKVRSRPEPFPKRLQVCRELHDLLHRKLRSSLGRSSYSPSFGNTLLPHERVCNDGVGRSLQPSFFRHRELHELLQRNLTSLSRFLNSLSLRETLLSHERISQGGIVGALLFTELQPLFFENRYVSTLQSSLFTSSLFSNKERRLSPVADSTKRKVSMNVLLSLLSSLSCMLSRIFVLV